MFEGSDSVRRVLDLAGEEAALLGHCYLGPEHVVLGVLRDGGSGAAQVLRAQGVNLQAARAALRRLAGRGVVPGPRPSDAELLGSLGIDLDAVRRDAELLGSLGIDLDAVRRDAERTFGRKAVGWATREATRARRRGVARVPRTPLCGPPMLAVQALQHAREQAKALGRRAVGPELLLLGVVEDIQTPWPRCMSNRWVRRLHASVGLPDGYQGAAGPLLGALGVDLGALRDAVSAELRGVER